MSLPETSLQQCIQDLSSASKILAHQEVMDAFGHVSCRHPNNPKIFMMSRNLAPGLVTPDDIVEYWVEPIDASGDPVHVQSAPKGFLERHIHAQIYARCPYVNSVVHFHAQEILPFGLDPNLELVPYIHMAGFMGHHSPPIFEISDQFGDKTDLLIKNSVQGKVLAELFPLNGDPECTRPLVLMRGHGATIVAPNIKQAVYRCVYTLTNARIIHTLRASGCRNGRPLSAGECQAAEANISTQIERPWQIWLKAIES